MATTPKNPAIAKWKDKADMAMARARKTTANATEKVKTISKKNAQKLREQTAQSRMQLAGGLLGAHATSVVAGQINRELTKRDKKTMARGVNYAAGLGGVALAVYGKGSTARTIGAALTGMSIYQLGADTAEQDLVPGYNDPVPSEGGY